VRDRRRELAGDDHVAVADAIERRQRHSCFQEADEIADRPVAVPGVAERQLPAKTRDGSRLRSPVKAARIWTPW
jgi:hypothetical protein